MKEEDLTKAIKLKDELDDKRGLLKLAKLPYMELKINFEEIYGHGSYRNVNSVLGDSVIKELRKKIIALIEERINELQKELEKL